ncbi:hypothetical protein D3C71_1488020 [compost metagenome]
MAQMPLAPTIEQGIGRAGIKATQATVAADQTQVGDTAQVQHGAVFIGIAEHRQMEGRHQRRTMPARRHIATAEVGHGSDAGQLGDAVGVTDLPGESRFGQRPMADGLAMRTNRLHLRARHPGFIQ